MSFPSIVRRLATLARSHSGDAPAVALLAPVMLVRCWEISSNGGVTGLGTADEAMAPAGRMGS